MTVDEAYELWKTNASKCYLCAYGEMSSMCGFYCFAKCKHADHDNVRYGVDICPWDCTDFVYSESAAHTSFGIMYYASPDYYNKTYNIDKDSPGYCKSYEERQRETALTEDANAIEFNKKFAGTGFCDIDPEPPEDFS